MRILHVAPYSPFPPIFGGALRVYHLLKRLVQNHRVTLLYFGEGDGAARRLKELHPQLEGVHVVPPPWTLRYRRIGQLYAHWNARSSLQQMCQSQGMQSTIYRLLAGEEYDLIQTEFCLMGSYRFPTGARMVLDAHNVEYDLYRRMAVHASSRLRKWHYQREEQRLFQEELDTYASQDALLVTSARDKALLDFHLPTVPKYIVPNGVETGYFRPSDEIHDPTSLVFTGMMGYVPNSDGMIWFLDRVFPLIEKEIPRVTINIVGNQPPRELLRRARENVVITGYVDDVRPHIWRSAVYVVPLLMGGGTRLKVLEAMAMKKPIVTTAVGCEGIDVRHGETALVANTPREFASSVIELLRNRSLQDRLSRNGHELVHAKYDWRIIGRQVESVYHDLMHPAVPLACGTAVNE